MAQREQPQDRSDAERRRITEERRRLEDSGEEREADDRTDRDPADDAPDEGAVREALRRMEENGGEPSR